MKQHNWIAYCAASGEIEFFETPEEAQEWLVDDEDYTEGIPREIEDGDSFIARITHRTATRVIDEKKRYPDGAWPYSAELDEVYDVLVKPVEEA